MRRRTLTRAVFASSLAALSPLGGAAAPGEAGLLGEGRAYAQAEVAPDSYVPPPGVPISTDPRDVAAEQEARRRLWIIALQPRLVVALGDGGGSGLPRVGFGGGVSVGRALFVRGRTRLGLGFGFGYERYQHETKPAPSFQMGDTTQSLSHASFSVDVRLDGLVFGGRVRPWASLGPAMSIASYADVQSDGNPSGVSETAILPALRAAVGLGVEVGSGIEVGARGEWLATFTSPAVGTPQVRPFSPGNFSLGIDVGFRF